MNWVAGTLFIAFVTGGIYATNQIADRDARIIELEAEVATTMALAAKVDAQDRQLKSLNDTVDVVSRVSKEETLRANRMRDAFMECQRVIGLYRK